MSFIDLHVHSSFSDGTLTPKELVALALRAGLSAFALTDHDTVEGVAAARRAAENSGLEVIPGIEFSTRFLHRDVHILGYLMDFENPGFQAALQGFLSHREARNERMCLRLQEYAGFPITLEALQKRWPDAILTRAHMASWLVEEGYVKNRDLAFAKYLGDRAPCFVPKTEVSPGDAIRLILRYGGVPVLAHPFLYSLSRKQLRSLLAELKEEGLMGVEALYPLNRSGEEAFIRSLAREYGLLLTGGSDFHGANKPDISLGTGKKGNLRVPCQLLDALKAAVS